MKPKGCGEANKVQIVNNKKNVNFTELKKRSFECLLTEVKGSLSMWMLSFLQRDFFNTEKKKEL